MSREDYDYPDYVENLPPHCEICKKQLNSNWADIPDTELYVIAGTYFEDPWSISHDLQPEYLICIKCFNEKIKPILELNK